MRNKVHSITESRIHGDMYVRFGGRFGETCGSNAVRRSKPSLQRFIQVRLILKMQSFMLIKSLTVDIMNCVMIIN